MFKQKGISHKGTKRPKNTLLKSNFTNNIFSVCLLWTTHIFEMARPTMNEHDISYTHYKALCCKKGCFSIKIVYFSPKFDVFYVPNNIFFMSSAKDLL
jgi:hypothetical protein